MELPNKEIDTLYLAYFDMLNTKTIAWSLCNQNILALKPVTTVIEEMQRAAVAKFEGVIQGAACKFPTPELEKQYNSWWDEYGAEKQTIPALKPIPAAMIEKEAHGGATYILSQHGLIDYSPSA